jgi:addiction module antidote protein, HigA family
MAKLGLPFRPYHPGELLKEELESRHIKQKEFAHKFGISYTALNEVLNGKRPVSTDFALLMEAALGVSADLLVRMQTSYNMQIARNDKKLTEQFNDIRRIASAL